MTQSAAAANDEDRLGTVLQNLGAAIGLGAYVALAGGCAEWARMAGAGLAASQGLAAIEPVTLLASGFQTLALVPILLVAILAAVRIAEDLQGSTRPLRSVLFARRGGAVVVQSVIVSTAAVFGAIPLYVAIDLFALAGNRDAGIVVVALASGASVPLLLAAAARRVAGQRLGRISRGWTVDRLAQHPGTFRPRCSSPRLSCCRSPMPR